MNRPRKQIPLRLPHDLYDAYARWAGDELRSVNAQIEAVLTTAARKAGRLRTTATEPSAGAAPSEAPTGDG